MKLNWKIIDRFLFGHTWTNSQIESRAQVLCEDIGPRWATSENEHQAAKYIRDQFDQDGLEQAALEPFSLPTWSYNRAIARLLTNNLTIDMLPFNRCPPCALTAPLVDVSYGTAHHIDSARTKLKGGIAIMRVGYEPFTNPVPLCDRINILFQAGAVAAMCIDPKDGGRMEYRSAGDWSIPELAEAPIPCVTTSREHGLLLQKHEGKMLRLEVESSFYEAKTHNVVGHLSGVSWPEQQIILGGHHDTVLGVKGGNDNASGTLAVLETARAIAALRDEEGTCPGCTLRFVTFSAEEQRLAGAAEYAKRHCTSGIQTRLMINLDELSTGYMKGIVLGFPHLRELVQDQLDHMNEGLQCHVMSQLDSTSDHFPFLRQGIDAAHLWRWRFHGRHADSNYHHEEADTLDKINIRELKEYAGQLARLILRLSHVQPEDWPDNPQTSETVEARLSKERGSVIRVY